MSKSLKSNIKVLRIASKASHIFCIKSMISKLLFPERSNAPKTDFIVTKLNNIVWGPELPK